MCSSDLIYKRVIAKAANTMQVTQAYIAFDNMKNPQNLTLSSQEFAGVSSENVEFFNKATSNSIAKGGIVIKVTSKTGGKTQVENVKLIKELIKEILGR